MEPLRHVLVVSTEASGAATLFRRFAPLLTKSDCELHRVPPDADVLEIVQATSFDMVLVGFPLERPAIRELITSIRWRESACRHTALMLVAEAAAVAEAESHLERGVNRVVCVDAPDAELRQAVHDLLDVAPRVALHTILRLELELEGGKEQVMAQTDNVSSSGMLVRGNQLYSDGTTFEFEFALPGQPRSIMGHAEIVRVTTAEREAVKGFAARFLAFKDDGRQRLEQYMLQQIN